MNKKNLSAEDYERIEKEFIRREQQRVDQEKRRKCTQLLIESAVIFTLIISIYVLSFLVFSILPPTDKTSLVVGVLILLVIAMGMSYLMRRAIKYFTTKFAAEQARGRQSL